jgi:hypothetical protein
MANQAFLRAGEETTSGDQRLICECTHDVFKFGSLPQFKMRLKASGTLVKVVDGKEEPYSPRRADCVRCGTTHYSDVWKHTERGR